MPIERDLRALYFAARFKFDRSLPRAIRRLVGDAGREEPVRAALPHGDCIAIAIDRHLRPFGCLSGFGDVHGRLPFSAHRPRCGLHDVVTARAQTAIALAARLPVDADGAEHISAHRTVCHRILAFLIMGQPCDLTAH